MRVMVCGSRDFRDKSVVFKALDKVVARSREDDPIQLIVGDARGADQWAREWATARNVPMQVFYAEWKTLGRRAGYERNARMWAMEPNIYLAFTTGPGISPGTNHTVLHAKENELPIWVYFGSNGGWAPSAAAKRHWLTTERAEVGVADA